MIFIRSLIFNIYFIFVTFGVAIFLCPVLLIKPIQFYPSRIWTHLGLKYICGITHKVEGKENIVKNSDALYISKHQSAWETFMFYAFVDKPAFVLKKELMRIPFVNFFFIALKMIVVDRSAGSKSLRKLVLDAKDRIQNKRQVVIFPEGTRTNHGEIAKLNPGVYSIYKEVETRYIPVALDSGKCWGRNAFYKKPGVITIKFFPALPLGLSKDEFTKQVHDLINAKLD